MTDKPQVYTDLPPVLPRHVGIIMDGNGRWAKKRGLPREAGHVKGVETFKQIVRVCKDFGLEYVTFYAFSTENWKRPKSEVDKLMELLRIHLRDLQRYETENCRLVFLGDTAPLDDALRALIERAQERTKNNTGLCINIALNYGGRDEIVHAAKCLCQEVQSGVRSLDQITQQTLAQHLYTAGQPDMDLMIRPSGEKRISNFLLWQAAYAEFVFMDVLWPDFTADSLKQALWEYYNRDRRFGGIGC